MHLATIYKEYYQSNYFSLLLKHGREKTCIKMELFTNTVNTNEIPVVYAILKRNLPSIFYSTCFNQSNLPFSVEVRRTEIGHLFEHILLEYLCHIKSSLGSKNVQFSGVTNWNWNKDKYGIFHIDVTAGEDDQYVFKEALKKSVFLINLILKDNVVINKSSVNFSQNFQGLNQILAKLNAESR